MNQGSARSETPTARERLESACSDFVLDWRNGEHHPLEYYVRDVPPDERNTHLKRLREIHGELLKEPSIATTVNRQADEDSHQDPNFPQIPNILNQRYEPRSLLGKGSFGEVWCAFDNRLKRYVAVKIQRSDRQFNELMREQFLKEGERLAQLSHSGIVTVFDVGTEAGYRYIVSELIQGMTLLNYRRTHDLSLVRCVELVMEIAEALHHAHLRNVVHRDLKPANIMVTQDGQPRILDFGLATTETEQLAEPSQVLGTYPYMSPEQIRGESHLVDARTDIYSLGVILYELLTDRRPFEGSTPQHFTEQILHREPRPLRTIDDSIPRPLEAVCLKCLEKDPKNRYSSCRDLSDELRQARWHFERRVSPNLKPLIAGALALALICLLGFAFWSQATLKSEKIPDNALNAPPPAPPKPETKRENELTITNLYTIGRPETNRYEILETTNELQMIADGEVIVKAGVVDEQTKTIDVTINQGNWPGRLGLILGYMHPTSNDRHRFQRIKLLRMSDGRDKLLRYTTRFPLHDPDEKWNSIVSASDVDLKLSGNRLIIHFEDGFVTQVEWNGKVLEKNSTPVDDRSADELMTGSFGFFVKGSTATFSSIRINGQPQKLIRR